MQRLVQVAAILCLFKDKSRLASAIQPDETNDLICIHLQRDPVDGCEVDKALEGALCAHIISMYLPVE